MLRWLHFYLLLGVTELEQTDSPLPFTAFRQMSDGAYAKLRELAAESWSSHVIIINSDQTVSQDRGSALHFNNCDLKWMLFISYGQILLSSHQYDSAAASCYIMSWRYGLHFWFQLSSAKVTVQKVAGSPPGYRHDILIKSSSSADCITRESKINHSPGNRIFQAWMAKEARVKQTERNWHFFFFFSPLF